MNRPGTGSGLSRRAALSLLAGAGLMPGALGATPSGAAPDDEGLAATAARTGLLWGAAIDMPVLADPALAELYRRETRIVTTENALKFDYLRPHPGPIRFEDADRLVDFCRSAGLAVRGAAMIWNDNAPGWLKSLPTSERSRIFDAHTDAVAAHFAGRLQSWDVVNEPFWPGHRLPGGYRAGPWYDTFGPDYIPRAFERVARVDPTARLVLNEAFTERSDELGRAVRTDLLSLIDQLLDRGTPLHAVGLEGHIQPQYGFDADGYGKLLDAIAGRGLSIYVTELDVDDHTLPEPVAERDAAVARYYAEFLAVALACPKVEVVQTWGLADPQSWFQSPGVMRELGTSRPARPLPFDRAFARKPAWHAAANALSQRRA